jgi:WD40 repeat protein
MGEVLVRRGPAPSTPEPGRMTPGPAGREDNTIRLWQVATRKEMAELRGHTAYVHALTFSPDGRPSCFRIGRFQRGSASAHERSRKPA